MALMFNVPPVVCPHRVAASLVAASHGSPAHRIRLTVAPGNLPTGVPALVGAGGLPELDSPPHATTASDKASPIKRDTDRKDLNLMFSSLNSSRLSNLMPRPTRALHDWRRPLWVHGRCAH